MDRVRQESSPEIVTAIEKATHDEDKKVSERAKLALQADVHHQMAIRMGMIEPDKLVEVDRSTPPPKRGPRRSRNVIIWILISSIPLPLGHLVGQIFYYLPLRGHVVYEMDAIVYLPLCLIPGAAIGSLIYLGYRHYGKISLVLGILLLLGLFVFAIFMGMVGEG